METKASYLAAGIFVIATVVGLIVFLLWVSQVDWTKGQKYDIYFSGSVTGLRVHEVVSYNGVPIGKVDKIDIDPKKVDLVHVIVEITEPKLISESSYATLESKGITGSLQIRILGSSRDSPSLKAKPGEERPIIQSQTSSIQAMIDETPKILEKITRLLDDMKPVFTTENTGALSRTFQNLDSFTTVLSQQNEEIKSFFHKVDETLESVRIASQQLEQFVSENRGPISNFTSSGLTSGVDLINQLDKLTKTVDRIAEKIDRNPTKYFFQTESQGEPLPE
jgi:phospholipid/cholesterol/gamma-HCH transport system substrate-binding protein